ncbi:peptide-methionine (S)-S-oxide reductase MsrA [Halomonas organivorans]|uniref:Peptide methionine sulfoxide reductase MsrA n=1 Tax=Halomonas organivorans TaxID=257772 RepID=A0A7W5BY06_9GAMM|nr:peptide-methionine (S)-S-oxide reductase MsrA [Halomonas organivorans]MBB3140278.1 peptide-methionine (S)-S-oxide reductase [Halomonas organivorans]
MFDTVTRPCLWPLLVAGLAAPVAAATTESAVFGGGCFWCMEQAYDRVEGVVDTTSGFSGGQVKNPSYDQVSSGGTGHIEVVKVDYDPAVVDYRTLLYVYWRNIDPFAVDRQFCDRGATYQSVIFAMNSEQRAMAEASRDAVAERFGREIGTEIRDFEAFYPAEDYHQDFYEKNPVRYHFYKSACGRSDRLKEVWGDEAEAHGMP